MILSVGFLRFVSSAKATQATGLRLLPRWDCLPLNMPAFAGHTMARKIKYSLSGGRPVIVVQHSAQTLSLLDRAGASHMARLGLEESISQALMVTFGVIVDEALVHKSRHGQTGGLRGCSTGPAVRSACRVASSG